MKNLATYFVESEQAIAEKAVSQQQQKFMGMVHAVQKGEKVKGASPELKKVAKTMGKKDVKDFAKTKHTGLPKKVGETRTRRNAVLEGIRAVTEARIIDEGGETFDHVLSRFKNEVKRFEQGEDLDSDLYEALFDYYSDHGEIPYGVAKGRTGDPYEWVTQRLVQDLGLAESAPVATVPMADEIINDAVRPEDIPAFQRKAAGKNFPATVDQVFDTGDKLSHIDTLRKMAGLPPRTPSVIQPRG